MLLTITNTRSPATNLGWLLHKHPNKVQSFRTTGGQAMVYYPEAIEERCTAALLTIDPIDLVRGTGLGGHALSAQRVNDRPCAASSLLSSGLTNVYSSALNGRCADRPDLVETPLPLTITLAVVQGWPDGVARLFEPLGYALETVSHPLDARFPDWGQRSYFTVTLRNTLPIRELLEQLYVLLPVLDNSRHSFVQEQDVDGLVKKGGNWLARHPERTAITRRFLRRQAGLTQLGFDAAALVEVIEHVDPARLPDLTRIVFGFVAPQTVFITTPNADYNELYGLDENQTRHDDHRFEWSRAEFSAWCTTTADRFGYQVRVSDVVTVSELPVGVSQPQIINA